MSEQEEDQKLAKVMDRLEKELATVSVEHLRIRVNQGDRRNFGSMRLPSGNTFENHQKQARLWLDFIDDWQVLKNEQQRNIGEVVP